MPKPFVIHDQYFEKAKRMWYRARSAFKLLEIQEKYNVIKPRMNVLDVAAAPGSFLQVIAKIIGPEGKAVGIDIQKIDPNFGFPNIHLLQESIFEYEKIQIFLENIGFWKWEFQKQESIDSSSWRRKDPEFQKPGFFVPQNDENWEPKKENKEIRSFSNFHHFDLITSDIAPSTTGMTGVDQYRSVELNLAILDVAKAFLKKWGNLVLKVFVWEDVNDLMWPLKENFNKVSRFKPKACRDRSFEEYFVCIGKK